jgi:hypothetical protein
MSFVPVSSAATTAASAAALQEHQRKLREEEEQMTGYDGEDLDGWEFKIVRASTRKFKHPRFVRQVCEEEARAGWEMLEKFDDYRIRFKRRVDHRTDDRHRDQDPYRTQIGMTGHMLELSVAGVVIGGLGVVALIAFLVYRMLQ